MIELFCYNLTLGTSEVIHEWPDNDVPFRKAEDFRDWMEKQDKSTDHYYDIRVKKGS